MTKGTPRNHHVFLKEIQLESSKTTKTGFQKPNENRNKMLINNVNKNTRSRTQPDPLHVKC